MKTIVRAFLNDGQGWAVDLSFQHVNSLSIHRASIPLKIFFAARDG